VHLPVVDDALGIVHITKPVLVKIHIPKLADEALDKGVLARFTGLDEAQTDVRLLPLIARTSANHTTQHSTLTTPD